jgi:hypothetical protein
MSAPRRLNRDDGRIGTGRRQKRRVRPSFAPSATKTAALSAVPPCVVWRSGTTWGYLSVTLAKLVYLPFVMVAGPQILTAMFLASTPGWRRNSAAFIAGAGVATTASVTISSEPEFGR